MEFIRYKSYINKCLIEKKESVLRMRLSVGDPLIEI